MKNNSTIHPMARNNTPAGKIHFLDANGKKCFFYSCINRLTGDRMTAYNDNAPSINASMTHIRGVFRDIRKTFTVTEVIGDF